MLTIMIPTMNRSEFLIRQLDYYADAGYPYEGLRHMKANLRAKNEISLVAFLNPQSPYYQDFMPIYQSINGAEACVS